MIFRALLLLSISLTAHAGQWPEWTQVTPTDMTEKVTVRHTDSYSAVGPKFPFPKQSDGCPIVEHGRVIGWSLGCKFSPPSGLSHGSKGFL